MELQLGEAEGSFNFMLLSWLVGWFALFCPVLFYLLLLCSSQLDRRPGEKHVWKSLVERSPD